MEISTVPVRFLKQAFTSGTSGSPLVVYRSAVCILKENAYLWYFKISHGLNIGDPIISMRGNLDNKTLHYYNKSENTLYLSSYLLTKTNIKTYAQLIADFKPKGILSYPSSLFTLVNLLEETGLKAHIPLLFTSSETFYPFQKEKIEKVLGGKSFDWYGNAERSLALGQCEAGNYHEMPLYSINEFTGDGAIATSLINKSFPLIRYHVEDTFQMMTTECACGRGTGISSVEGRVDDVVMFYDGSQVGRLGLAFQGINNLRYAQIIQEDLAGITVNLVTTPEFTKADQDLILKKLKLRLNNSLIITFNKVQEDAIIKTKAGKYKLVISRLPR
jgi:phenylacetate-CoA ligase